MQRQVFVFAQRLARQWIHVLRQLHHSSEAFWKNFTLVRPISVSAVPFGPDIDFWRRGELGRFVSCSVGADHSGLRRIGWEKCGHGLTSRPRESASEVFLNELLLLFRHPPRSAAALLRGTLPLRYCAGRFASRIPTWRLLLMGTLLVWVLKGVRRVGIVPVEHCSHAVLSGFDGCGSVDWVSGPGGGAKRVRLNTKLQHLVGHGSEDDFVSECVSFPKKINNPLWRGHRFFRRQ